MLQQDPTQWSTGISHAILAPHIFRGVARSRHDVEHAADVEKQAAQRVVMSAERRSPQITNPLWNVLSQVVHRLAGAVWRAHGSRSGSTV